MASIFKTGLFPEQQRVVAEFKALTAETGYLLPSHMIRLIYTEIGLDPTKTPLLTEFAANFIEQLGKFDFVNFQSVVDITGVMEGMFKLPK